MAAVQLLKINNVNIPNPKSGNMEIQKNPDFEEYACTDSSSVIEMLSEGKISGSVTLKLFQSAIYTIANALTTVSTMDIYDPETGTVRTITALIENRSMPYILKDSAADVWGYNFSFRQIST